MARSRTRKLLDAMRRMIRRRRAPSPSEAEWLRLILVLRRLQHGQIASLQRLDGVRGLAASIGAFRGEFRALHGELIGAREAAEHLEKGLDERLQRLDGLPDPAAERQDIDMRLARLDELAARFGRALEEGGFGSAALEQGLAQLASATSRMEAALAAERGSGAGDELARIYQRIEELAEESARTRGARGGADVDALGQRIEVRLAELEATLSTLGTGTSSGSAEAIERVGERLADLAQRLEHVRVAATDGAASQELVARLEAAAARIEAAPALIPDLPNDALVGGTPIGVPVEEHEKLRATFAAAHEAHRRAETELEALRGQLRASELARVELETRHAAQLAEVADHAGRQLARLEEDLRKKKRGLSELTQQNIQLQNLVARLQAEAGVHAPRAESHPPAQPQPEPPAALPRSAQRPLTGLRQDQRDA